MTLSLFEAYALVGTDTLLGSAKAAAEAAAAGLGMLLGTLHVKGIGGRLGTFVNDNLACVVAMLAGLHLQVALFLVLQVLGSLRLVTGIPVFSTRTGAVVDREGSLGMTLSMLLGLFHLKRGRGTVRVLGEGSTSVLFHLFIATTAIKFLIDGAAAGRASPVLFQDQMGALLLVLGLLKVLVSLGGEGVAFLTTARLVLAFNDWLWEKRGKTDCSGGADQQKGTVERDLHSRIEEH